LIRRIGLVIRDWVGEMNPVGDCIDFVNRASGVDTGVEKSGARFTNNWEVVETRPNVINPGQVVRLDTTSGSLTHVAISLGEGVYIYILGKRGVAVSSGLEAMTIPYEAPVISICRPRKYS